MRVVVVIYPVPAQSVFCVVCFFLFFFFNLHKNSSGNSIFWTPPFTFYY